MMRVKTIKRDAPVLSFPKLMTRDDDGLVILVGGIMESHEGYGPSNLGRAMVVYPGISGEPIGAIGSWNLKDFKDYNDVVILSNETPLSFSQGDANDNSKN